MDGSSGGVGTRPCPALPCLPVFYMASSQPAFSLPGLGSPIPHVRQTHSSHTPSAAPPPRRPTLPWGRREERRRSQASARDHSHPLPQMPSVLGPFQIPLPHSSNTGNSANSFRQYPAPCSLPQIQGKQGGAEGADRSGGVQRCSPPLELPFPTPNT